MPYENIVLLKNDEAAHYRYKESSLKTKFGRITALRLITIYTERLRWVSIQFATRQKRHWRNDEVEFITDHI
jgi:hypothetical protein